MAVWRSIVKNEEKKQLTHSWELQHAKHGRNDYVSGAHFFYYFDSDVC